ncbi:MAG TPA: VOC family protein, partial [Aggregatilineales bacterium]|nr:VOC family protein [Aggregatilineales bacterium]
MEKRNIVHLEIPAKDRHAAAKFYEDLFGWKMSHMDEYNYTTFSTGSAGGGLADVDENRQPGSVFVYVETPSIDNDVKSIQAGGGELRLERMPVPGGSIALFGDVTGNTMGLYESDPAQDNGSPPQTGRAVVHVEIPAKDTDGQAKFYEKLFGWDFTVDTMPVPYVSFKAGNTAG